MFFIDTTMSSYQYNILFLDIDIHVHLNARNYKCNPATDLLLKLGVTTQLHFKLQEVSLIECHFNITKEIF